MKEKNVVKMVFDRLINGRIKKVLERDDWMIIDKRGKGSGDRLNMNNNLNNKGEVYNIECEFKDVYTGETGRMAIIRKKEHEADVRYSRKGRTKLVDHVIESNHTVSFDKMEIKRTGEFDVVERKISEAI